jgi:zinc protease
MILPKSLLIFCLSLVSLVISSSQPEIYQFNNRLKLMIKENHLSPIFIMQTGYDVESSNKTLSIAGVSHLLEHIMFKGYEKISIDKLSKIIVKMASKIMYLLLKIILLITK